MMVFLTGIQAIIQDLMRKKSIVLTKFEKEIIIKKETCI